MPWRPTQARLINRYAMLLTDKPQGSRKMVILPHQRGDYEPIGTRSRIPGGRIVTRHSAGAEQMELWEQFMPPGGEIPLHYHEVEESLTFLSGEVEVTVGAERQRLGADTTVFVPAHALHSIRNVGGEPVRLLAFFPTSAPAVLYPDEDG